MKTPLPLAAPWKKHHGPRLQPLLSHWKASGNISPVLLITGPEGCGKREISFWLSQWLLCEKNGPAADLPAASDDLFAQALSPAPENSTASPSHALEPCGKCSACIKANHETWVDFTELAPETGSSLKIEELRKLRTTLGFGAFSGAYRITLIRDADRLTPQAANSLLKTLEEPPPGFIFILLATDAQLLLPTLVSRCQRLRLDPPSEAIIQELLAPIAQEQGLALDAEPFQRATREARGNWHRGEAALHPTYWEMRERLISFLRQPWFELDSLLQKATEDEEASAQLLDQIDAVSSQLLLGCHSGQTAPELQPYADEVLRTRGLDSAYAFWMERAEQSFRARSELRLPLNKKLWMQELLTAWVSTSNK